MNLHNAEKYQLCDQKAVEPLNLDLSSYLKHYSRITR